MPVKWVMFAVFLWMAVAMLSAITEYAWVSSTETSKLYSLIHGVGLTSWVGAAVLGGGTVVTGLLAGFVGNRAFTAVAAIFFVGFALAFRDIISFNYPTLFYGPYEIVRWIFLGIGIVIFVTVVANFLRGGTSS